MRSQAEFEAAGLYDPTIHDGTTRLELLQWLDSLDITIAAMQDANAEGELPPVAADQRLLGGPLVTKEEALAISGLDEAEFDEYVSALGFVRLRWAPDDSLGFTAGEARMLATFGAMTGMFSHAEAFAFVRVIGQALGRIGDAGVSLFLADVEARMLQSGEDEFDIAKAGYEASGLVDGLAELFDPLLRRTLIQATERTRITTIAQDERLLYRYAVGFVDLVGFTERSAAMEPRELAGFLRDFEARAHEVVTAAGARIVKHIGDEVMFAGADANAVCRAARDLTAGFGEGDDAVVPRGGVGFGNVITQGGDYFGPVVNLASRLVDAAVPEEILVSAEVVDAASDCVFEPAGRRMVKGFLDPVTVFSLAAEGPANA